MRAALRVAVLPLAAVLAVLLTPALPAAAAVPTASLAVSQPKAAQGSVSFVVTPRYVLGPIDPRALAVSSGGTTLAVQTAAATADIAPRALMLVVEAGSQISPSRLAAERSAALAIGNGAPADVALGVVAVTTTPILVLAPTTARSAFANAVNGIEANGQPALLDALGAAAAQLAAGKAGAENRIVIIGTGDDSSSTLTAEALAPRLTAAGAVVDAVLSTSDASADLRALVQGSGGRVQLASGFGSLATAARPETALFQPAIAVTATVPPALAGTTGELDIAVAGTKLAASVPVTFAGTPAVAGGTGSTSFAWVPAWLAVIFAGILFLALITAILGVIWPRSLKQDRIRQISNFGPGARAAASAPKTPDNSPVTSVIARTALAATASVVRSGRMEGRISRRLERAGMRMRAHEWVLLRACLVVTGGALLFAATNWIGALVGAAIGWAGTLLYQTVRIDRRANQFAEQLPDALQLVIGSLKSGFSLPQALDSLVRESQEPVASEFGRALSEHRLGVDISDALERVAQRAESEDLGWTVMAVRIQREVGGNLAEVLQTTVDTMRERGRLRRHVRALSAEGRLSAYVLIGLPLVLGLFMFIYRRSYMAPLFTDPIGIIMVSVGGLLFILGIFWMTRVVKVEA